MFILYLIGYLLIGLIVAFGIATIHMIKALKKGYDVIGYWENHKPDKSNRFADCLRVIRGCLVWPIQAILWMIDEPKLYEEYELRQ